jgi:hypothetical protein
MHGSVVALHHAGAQRQHFVGVAGSRDDGSRQPLVVYANSWLVRGLVLGDWLGGRGNRGLGFVGDWLGGRDNRGLGFVGDWLGGGLRCGLGLM